MAKDQEVSLPVLDDLVKDYADGVRDQATWAWQQCDAMRQALLAGDVDTGLAIMREVCPAALEDMRLVFRAKKQKFVELLRSGSDPEAALACARSELAPLALDAYPEAYGEFKRLLLLLLSAPRNYSLNQQLQQLPLQQRNSKGAGAGAGDVAAAGDTNGGVDGLAGLWELGSTAAFADLAYFTVRSMLGLQQPLLSLQLRFLLRLHATYPGSGTTPGGAAAAELVPRLRAAAAGGGSDRDPAPLPPLAAMGRGGGGGGPPSFPESGVQAVIQGAGTGRQAALDALKRYGGDPLSAFKSEVGRLRLDEHLLSELALEYGRFRGLLTPQQTAALADRAAAAGAQGAGGKPASEPICSSHLPSSPNLQQQQQQQQPPGAASQQGTMGTGPASAAGPGRPALQGPGPGLRGRSRGEDASRAGSSPPSKLARRSPPIDEEQGIDGSGKAGGAAVDEMEVDEAAGGAGTGKPSPREGDDGRGADLASLRSWSDPIAVSGSGSGSGLGSAYGGSQQQLEMRGEEVLSALLRLGQEGDAKGVLALVTRVDPQLWEEHPGLLFDVWRCQYGKLLSEGLVTEALELARREMTPLANANPTLLPLLKNAMTALLPPMPLPAVAAASVDAPPPPPLFLPSAPGAQAPPPPPPSAPAATVGCGGSSSSPSAAFPSSATSSSPPSASLLPALRAVVGAIQAALQPRLGLQGPRLVRLMEGLLASHRAWMRSERMSADPFAEAMRISPGLRAAQLPAQTATAAVPEPNAAIAAAAAVGAGAGAGAAAPRARHAVAVAAPAGAAAQGLRQAGARERSLMEPWYDIRRMEQHILAQVFRRGARGAAAATAAAGAGPEALHGTLVGMPPPAPGGGGGPGLGGPGDEEEGGMQYGADGVPVGEAVDVEDDDDSGGSGGGEMLDEDAVLQLMEVLELPRGAAVELLHNHGGDVQAAILSVMS